MTRELADERMARHTLYGMRSGLVELLSRSEETAAGATSMTVGPTHRMLPASAPADVFEDSSHLCLCADPDDCKERCGRA